MANAIQFIAPRVAITDPETGLLTRAGLQFFQSLWERTGGVSGVILGMPPGGSSSGGSTTVIVPENDDTLFNDTALTAQVAEMGKRIQTAQPSDDAAIFETNQAAQVAELKKQVNAIPVQSQDDLLSFAGDMAITAEIQKRCAAIETMQVFD